MAGYPLRPPRELTSDGAPRRVGVEVEYSGIDCAEAAELVRRLFGGTTEEVDPHRHKVRGTCLGDFTVELDMSAAHPRDKDQHSAKRQKLGDLLDEAAHFALGEIGSLVMPREVVSPPLRVEQFTEIDRLIEAMRRHGAKGTESNPLHAFGLHLNPEAAALDAGYIVDHLKAFMLLAPWLRAEIGVDLSRRLAPYIEVYPDRYVRQVVDPGYRPGLVRLIDDYLAANPSRNRELDMLPLFAHLDPDRVAHCVKDKHVKPRPTFHYRLPNSRVGDPGWGIMADWNRWVAVERLAADSQRLARLGRDFLGHAIGGASDDWADRVRKWIG